MWIACLLIILQYTSVGGVLNLRSLGDPHRARSFAVGIKMTENKHSSFKFFHGLDASYKWPGMDNEKVR